MYIKASGSVIQRYPYSLAQLRKDYPRTSFPRELSEDQWNRFGAYKLIETAKPDADVVTEGTPVKIGRDWTQQWDSRNFTSAEIQRKLVSLQQSVVNEAQSRLDKAARDHGYDSIISACTYTNSTVTRYKLEGDYCLALRDATWSTLETILAEIQAGDRAIPQGYADVEGDLPPIIWPV